MQQTTPEVRESLKHGRLEDPVLSLEDIEECILATAPRRAQCWIHGTEAFVKSLLPWIGVQQHFEMYFIISDSSGRQKIIHLAFPQGGWCNYPMLVKDWC